MDADQLKLILNSLHDATVIGAIFGGVWIIKDVLIAVIVCSLLPWGLVKLARAIFEGAGRLSETESNAKVLAKLAAAWEKDAYYHDKGRIDWKKLTEVVQRGIEALAADELAAIQKRAAEGVAQEERLRARHAEREQALHVAMAQSQFRAGEGKV